MVTTEEMIAEARAAYNPIGLTEAQLVAYADMCVQFMHSKGLLPEFSDQMTGPEGMLALAVSERFAEHLSDEDLIAAYKVAVVDTIGDGNVTD